MREKERGVVEKRERQSKRMRHTLTQSRSEKQTAKNNGRKEAATV